MSAYELVKATFLSALAELTEEETPRILVAFSGGADSSLLLHLLCETDAEILAAHVNHGIRGVEADQDEAFCRCLCANLVVPLFVCKRDVPAIAKAKRLGLEETAREVRYDYLQKIAAEQDCSLIATAHNADDNLETILFHLTRGSGLKGLCGIPPRRDNCIRPLLGCSKEDILAACQEIGIPYVIDSTNADTGYTRNFLRAEVIPRLKTLNPKAAEASVITSAILTRDEYVLSNEASRYSLANGRKQLVSLPDAILSRVLLREMREAGLSPDHRHIDAAISTLRSSSARTQLAIPGGLLSVDRDAVIIGNENQARSGFDIPLSMGLTTIDDCSAIYFGVNEDQTEKDINKLKNIYKFAIKVSIDSATMNRLLRARSRLPHDAYRYGGMTRSVKKLLQSQKTTAKERSRLPMIVDRDTILWIPGFPVADAIRPTDPAHSAILMYLYNS